MQGKEPEHVPFPWNDVPNALRAGCVHSALDITVLSTRGMLDRIAQLVFPDWLGYKMCKGEWSVLV